MPPKVVSIGYAVPHNGYTQREIFDALGYSERFYAIFSASGIQKRYFAVPLESLVKLSFQSQQESYAEAAIPLIKEAAKNALDGRDVKDIGCIAFSTCTGFLPGPVIPHYLIKELALSPEVQFTNITSHGCEGGFPSLMRARDYTIAHHKPSLAITCELCSTTYFPENPKPDPENHYEQLRANAIFGDAAVCALIDYDDNPRHPVILDSAALSDPSQADKLGYIWRNGRLKVRLDKKVPEIASKMVAQVTRGLLAKHGLQVKDISYWIVHAAGSQVIDLIRDRLELLPGAVQLSRETLGLYGNTSSTSVGITGKRLMNSLQELPATDTYAAMLSMGPGMTAGCTLLKFGVKYR